MARVWPYAPMHLAGIGLPPEPVPIHWPTPEHERLLIELYFTYVHPDLPVLHKPSFMALCRNHLSRETDIPPRSVNGVHLTFMNKTDLNLQSCLN